MSGDNPAFFAHPDPTSGLRVCGFGTGAFRVMLIPRNTANVMVRANHYSRKVVQNSRIHLGVFRRNKLLGVLQFGPAMNPRSMASVVAGTEYEEYLELNRMWLDDRLPKNSESKAISHAFKIIRRNWPRVAWVQSFADERCKRAGVVYQAANFLYVGSHMGRFHELDGVFYHDSILTNSHRANTPSGKLLRENRDRLITHRLRQYRYIYFLRPSFRPRLLKKEQPFPKHATEGSAVIRPAHQPGGVGSFPTRRSICKTRAK